TLSAERNTHVEEFAAITFEPWQGNPEIEGQSVVGKEAVERLGQNARVAHTVMFQSKENLVEFMRDLSTAEWDYMAGCIDGARDVLQAVAEIANAAAGQLGVAAAALAQDIGKDADASVVPSPARWVCVQEWRSTPAGAAASRKPPYHPGWKSGGFFRVMR